MQKSLVLFAIVFAYLSMHKLDITYSLCSLRLGFFNQLFLLVKKERHICRLWNLVFRCLRKIAVLFIF